MISAGVNVIKIESTFYFEDIDLSIFLEVSKEINLSEKEIEKLANMPKSIHLKDDEIIITLSKDSRLWPNKISNNEKEKYCFSYLRDEAKCKKPFLSEEDYVESTDTIGDMYKRLISIYGKIDFIFDSLSWVAHGI